jgi:hypothetical protein
MKKFLTIIMFFGTIMCATSQQIDYGVHGRYSFLRHKTNFETTDLINFYDNIAQSKGSNYSFKDFENDYSLKKYIFTPQIGATAEATIKQFPIFLLGEIMSSTSALEKFAFSIEGGLGKDILLNDGDNFITVKAGYKLLRDGGFGKNTILNSFKKTSDKVVAQTFLDEKNPLGQKTGEMISIRLGVGHKWDSFKVGAQLQIDIDLTDKLKRFSRMNAISLGVYCKFLQDYSDQEDSNDYNIRY